MAEERMKILEERLTRLEAALSQRPSATGTGGGDGGGFTPPGGVVSDPAPWPGQWQFIPRPTPDCRSGSVVAVEAGHAPALAHAGS